MAFSMYSRIPMPKIIWKKEHEKYILCFFPFVGMVTGILSVCCFFACKKLEIGRILRAAMLTVLPLLVNGGIHMDGFLDTIDAKSSYKPKEEKLRILKDPNIGAFALIYGMVYLVLTFGLFSEIGEREINFVAWGYVYSRVLSGFSVVTFRKAKKEGMAAATAENTGKSVKLIFVLEFCLCVVCFIGLHPLLGLLCAVTGIFTLVYYRSMAYRLFGGITGDLAGYFLQVCELIILVVTVLFGKVQF